MSEAPHALQGLYGARKTRQANTAKAAIGTGDRPQDIFTPEHIWRTVSAWWGLRGIALDPCGHPDSPVSQHVDHYLTGRKVETGRVGKNGPIMEWEGPGTSTPWADRTFWNPPYDDLEPWLYWAALQEHDNRWCGLIPVRPQRAWWWPFMDEVDCVGYLPPTKYVGATSGLPLPVCLPYRGPDWPDLLYSDTPEARAMRALGAWRRVVR